MQKITITIENPTAAIIAALSSVSEPAHVRTIGLIDLAKRESEEEEINGEAPDVDSKGMPWDERIHSKGKSLIGDGTWRYKKGVPNETIEAVEAELQAVMYGAVEEVKPNMTPQELVKKITSAKLPPATVMQACAAIGLTALPALFQHPDKVDELAAALGLS